MRGSPSDVEGIRREWRLPRHSIRWAILSLPLHRTRDKAKAVKSRLTYGANPDGSYSTSVLGVLNGLFGVGVRLIECTTCDRPNGPDTHREIRAAEIAAAAEGGRVEFRGGYHDERGVTFPVATGRVIMPADGSPMLYEPMCGHCGTCHHPTAPHQWPGIEAP